MLGWLPSKNNDGLEFTAFVGLLGSLGFNSSSSIPESLSVVPHPVPRNIEIDDENAR